MKFTYKNEAELEKMTAEERDNYATEKRKHEQELAKEAATKVFDEKIKALEDKLEKAEKDNKENKDQVIDKINKSIDDLKEAQKNVDKSLEDLGKQKQFQPQPQAISFKQSVASAIKEKHEALKTFYKANESIQSGSFEIQVKAAAVTTTGNITPTGAADIYAAQSVDGVSEYQRGDIFLEQYLDAGSTELASIPYVDESPGEGDAAIVAEGSLKPLIDVDYATQYSQARKVAGRMKATEEALYDYGWLESAMTNTLKKKHDIARQNDLIGATNGIESIATAFNASILGGVKVVSPQYYDCIAALVAGIANDSEGYYIPNVIFVNTLDNLTKMLTKDDNKNYVMPPFADAQGNIIEGVRVVARPSLTAGSFIVGDFKNVKLRNLWGYTVRFGWENDDFGKNQITMVGESRYHLYATTNDKRGIIKGTFADVITALTPV